MIKDNMNKNKPYIGAKLYYDNSLPYIDEIPEEARFTLPPSREPDIEPYPGGNRFVIPDGARSERYSRLGILDVTAAPFFADNTGKTDCTKVINEAIVTARTHQMVLFFPLGTYAVSDTIHAQQIIEMNDDRIAYRVHSRKFPVVMIGERRIENGETLRPVIYLLPKSKGFMFREVHKPVIDVYCGPCPEANAAPGSIENMITGINIKIGEGNIGAIGIDFYAAQGSAVEDCVIDVGDGYCGIWGSSGNGGSHAQVTIIGGRIGMDISKGTPGSCMEGFVFDRQRDHAIVANAKQAATFVGCRIYTNTDKVPVVSFGGSYELMQQGRVSLIDSIIEFDNPPKEGELQAAVSSRESIYLRNVYVKNASHAVLNPDRSQAVGNPKGWMKVREFVNGIDSMPVWGGVYSAPLYLDGKRLEERTLVSLENDAEPEESLVTKHNYFLPVWHDVLEYNVKEKYGAKGNGVADDTAALQKAIDENEFVFLPKGYYRITDTLMLKANTKIVGVAQGLSQIIVTQQADGQFADESREYPALDTPNQTDASVILAYAGIVTARELIHVYALRWRVAGKSLLRNFTFYMDPAYRITWITKERRSPWVRIEDSGGGKWYNFWCDITQLGKDYRILKISRTRNPLAFYALNPEHSRSDYEMEIDGCENIAIYALKSECNSPNLLIKDSNNIALFTSGGDASTYPGSALYVIENSTNITFTLLNDYRVTKGQSKEFFSGYWYPPGEWHMLRQISGDVTLSTEPWERPAIYKIGEFKDIFQ